MGIEFARRVYVDGGAINMDTETGESVLRFTGIGTLEVVVEGSCRLGSTWVRKGVKGRRVRSSIPSRLRRLDCHCIFARTGSKSVRKLDIFPFRAMRSMTHFLKM